MDEYLISVIIPTYNSEFTIEKCISSIQNQTYENLEIIIINDGSTDSTKEIVLKLQKNDNRIKIYNIPNGGVSHARNVGIDNATGNFVAFVDSDDYIDADMYECLINIIKKYDVKIAHCSYKNVDDKGNIISIVGGSGKIINQDHDTAITYLISGNLFAGGMCNKLYSKDLFEAQRLNESIKYNEDVLMNYYLFSMVNKSVYIDKAFYNYVVVVNSSTHSGDGVIASEQCLLVAEEIYQCSIGKTYENIAELRMAKILLNLYGAYIFLKKEKNDKNVETMKRILEFKSRGFYNSSRDKILIFFYRRLPNLFRIIFKLYDKIRVKKLDPKQ